MLQIVVGPKFSGKDTHWDKSWKLPFFMVFWILDSGRPNRSGSGSAELTGSVRFGGSAEPRGSVNRTRTEPKHYINPIFY